VRSLIRYSVLKIYDTCKIIAANSTFLCCCFRPWYCNVFCACATPTGLYLLLFARVKLIEFEAVKEVLISCCGADFSYDVIFLSQKHPWQPTDGPISIRIRQNDAIVGKWLFDNVLKLLVLLLLTFVLLLLKKVHGSVSTMFQADTMVTLFFALSSLLRFFFSQIRQVY